MMHTRYEAEIREVEARLTYEREALAQGAEDLTQTAKYTAASPKGLLIAAVVGFVLGELTRTKRRRKERDAAQGAAARGVGLSSLLGGVALALIRAQFGSPLGMGKAALEYAAARRRDRDATHADPDSPSARLPNDPARVPPSSYPGSPPA